MRDFFPKPPKRKSKISCSQVHCTFYRKPSNNREETPLTSILCCKTGEYVNTQ